jgi:hypothetical protein
MGEWLLSRRDSTIVARNQELSFDDKYLWD